MLCYTLQQRDEGLTLPLPPIIRASFIINEIQKSFVCLFACLFILYPGSIFRGKFKYPSAFPYGPAHIKIQSNITITVTDKYYIINLQ